MTFAVSCVRACHLAQFSRAAWYRPSRANDQAALRSRIRKLAHARPRFWFLRIWVLLRREGWLVNKKRVRRLYRLVGLQLRMRVRRDAILAWDSNERSEGGYVPTKTRVALIRSATALK